MGGHPSPIACYSQLLSKSGSQSGLERLGSLLGFLFDPHLGLPRVW